MAGCTSRQSHQDIYPGIIVSVSNGLQWPCQNLLQRLSKVFIVLFFYLLIIFYYCVCPPGKRSWSPFFVTVPYALRAKEIEAILCYSSVCAPRKRVGVHSLLQFRMRSAQKSWSPLKNIHKARILSGRSLFFLLRSRNSSKKAMVIPITNIIPVI